MLWMVMWVGCIIMKLTLSYGKLYAEFGKSLFSDDSHELYRLTD